MIAYLPPMSEVSVLTGVKKKNVRMLNADFLDRQALPTWKTGVTFSHLVLSNLICIV